MTTRTCVFALSLAGLAFGVAPVATAQDATSSVAPSPTQVKRDNLARLMRQMPEVNFDENRLEDVISFIVEITGADIEPVWIGDAQVDGLDPDLTITLSARRVSALRLLEMVLDKADDGSGLFAGGNTWQMTDWGTVQIGPKGILSRRTRLEVYPITDLLWEIPDYEEAPEIDLQTVLQSSQGGGGGGQSPFQDDQDDDYERVPLEDRALDLIDIIEQLVEPETWQSGGGNATISYFQGNLLVRGPDFLHRNLGGYPWWPSSQTSSRVVEGRRYVSIGVDTGIADVDRFINQPVTGVAGGGAAGGGP